jgi:hypothetical protein
MPDFITLTCPACGGKLKVTNDKQQFVCTYCGTEHIIKRDEGIISLAPVVESWKKTQIGIERTASEMAITRLKGEIAELEKEISRVRKKRNSISKYYVFGGISALLGVMSLLSVIKISSNGQNNNAFCGGSLLLVGAVLIFIAFQAGQQSTKTRENELNYLLRMRTQKEKELNYHENLVSRTEFSQYS